MSFGGIGFEMVSLRPMTGEVHIVLYHVCAPVFDALHIYVLLCFIFVSGCELRRVFLIYMTYDGHGIGTNVSWLALVDIGSCWSNRIIFGNLTELFDHNMQGDGGF